MSDKNIESKVESAILNEITNLGYELYDVEYLKEGRDFYLKIYIDSENGIGIKDCEKVNNAIEPILDEKDLIKDQYFLEISSIGIEPNLKKEKHYLNAIDKKIEVKLYKKIKDTKLLTGILKGYKDNIVKLETQEEIIDIDVKEIASAKVIYDW